MIERFVSNIGSGSTYSRATPGHPKGAIAASSGDDIITLLGGTSASPVLYTGTNYMIQVTAKSGSSGHPITIRADVEGGVVIDGQGSDQPFYLYNGSSWWIVEGINFRDSNGDAVGKCELNSNNNIIRRCVGWDGPDINSSIFLSTTSATNNLFEDCAGFGTARKIFQGFSGSNDVIFRRCFGVFNFSTSAAGPIATISPAYDCQNNIVENCIFTWDEDGGTDISDHYGLLTHNQVNRFDFPPGDNHVSDTYFSGCIGYFKSGQSGFFNGGFQGGQIVQGVIYENCAIYIDHANASTASLNNFDTGTYSSNPNIGHHLTNVTEIDTAGDDSMVDTDWIKTNRNVASSLGTAYPGGQSLYVNDGAHGATILYRLESRVLTGVSLWPWPMNQRIIDAMTFAGRTPIDVQSDIDTLFGVAPTIVPGATAPVDNFNTYSAATDLAGDNAGTNWTGVYISGGGATMTTETAPSGFSGKSVKSIGNGTTTYYYRECNGVSADSFRWAMMSTVTNPNDDFYGVSLHESGVNIRTQVQFSSGGNIRAYDYDTAAWVNVLVGFSANVRYNIELAIDTTNQPDQYRVRVNAGTWSAWLGVNGSLSVVNLFQFNNFSSNGTIWFDDIGSGAAGSLTNPVLAYTSLTEGVLTT